LQKWHRIEKGKPHNADEIGFVVELVMGWIDNQISAKPKRARLPCPPFNDSAGEGQADHDGKDPQGIG
jgi:hypothetical protein